MSLSCCWGSASPHQVQGSATVTAEPLPVCLPQVASERPWEVACEQRAPTVSRCVVCGGTSEWTDPESGGEVNHARCRSRVRNSSSALCGALEGRHHRRPTRRASRRCEDSVESSVGARRRPESRALGSPTRICRFCAKRWSSTPGCARRCCTGCFARGALRAAPCNYAA
jgi:hypothetical protein